jgi:lipid-A-disaccharide synthase
MKPKSFMLIAGEASGDTLAAELVSALRVKVLEAESAPTADVQPLRTELEPRFFGAGGPRLKAAGVELAFDMTQHSVIGLSDVLKNYFKFRRLFNQLLKLAIERQPDAIIGVDYGGFNLRFGHAIKQFVRANRSQFNNWNPKLIQFVSPQVWASRPDRAYQLERDYDLLLSIFPFEKDWYARRVPKLRVEFVGHPMVGRFKKAESGKQRAEAPTVSPKVLLLPGSREDEVRRHLPLVYDVAVRLNQQFPNLQITMVLPTEKLKKMADTYNLFGIGFQVLSQDITPSLLSLKTQVGGLTSALAEADLAITKSGTITMECALFGVPAVVFYKTSWPTYFIGKQIVSVKYLAMPNLLAGREIFPEFIQHAATPENISRAAADLLKNPSRRREIQTQLEKIVSSLGEPGASQRAAEAVMRLLD